MDAIIKSGGGTAAVFCGPSPEVLAVQQVVNRLVSGHALDESNCLVHTATPLFVGSSRQASWYRFGASPKPQHGVALGIFTLSFLNAPVLPPYVALRMPWRVSIWYTWLQQLKMEPNAELGLDHSKKTMVVKFGQSHTKKVYIQSTWCTFVGFVACIQTITNGTFVNRGNHDEMCIT